MIISSTISIHLRNYELLRLENVNIINSVNQLFKKMYLSNTIKQ